MAHVHSGCGFQTAFPLDRVVNTVALDTDLIGLRRATDLGFVLRLR